MDRRVRGTDTAPTDIGVKRSEHAQRPAKYSKEVLMRLLAWTILSIAALSVAPVQAQTFGSAFPVCIQTYGITGNAIDCSYASMDQCRASASGRAAQCIVNPYYAAEPARRKLRRY
jgi:hypothetical protein